MKIMNFNLTSMFQQPVSPDDKKRKLSPIVLKSPMYKTTLNSPARSNSFKITNENSIMGSSRQYHLHKFDVSKYAQLFNYIEKKEDDKKPQQQAQAKPKRLVKRSMRVSRVGKNALGANQKVDMSLIEQFYKNNSYINS